MKQISFEIEAKDGYPIYRDALWIQDDAILTDDEIETMKQERYLAFKATINSSASSDHVEYIDSDPINNG